MDPQPFASRSVLFPTVEETLPVDELERLGAAFARAETHDE
jgi:hypothetical protein